MKRNLYEIDIALLNTEYKAVIIYGNKNKAIEYLESYFEEIRLNYRL